METTGAAREIELVLEELVGEEAAVQRHIVDHQAEVRVVCAVNGDLDASSSLLMLHDGQVLREEAGDSAVHSIPSFEPSHSGVYECLATRPDGTLQRTKASLLIRAQDDFDPSTFNLGPCSDAFSSLCQNGGTCYQHLSAASSPPTCRCAFGFTGRQCQYAMVQPPPPGLNSALSTAIGLLFVAALAALCATLVLLHVRRRRRQRRQQLQDPHSPLRHSRKSSADAESQQGLLDDGPMRTVAHFVVPLHSPPVTKTRQLLQTSQQFLPSLHFHRSLRRQRSSPSRSSISSAIMNVTSGFIRHTNKGRRKLVSESGGGGAFDFAPLRVEEAEAEVGPLTSRSEGHVPDQFFLPHSL